MFKQVERTTGEECNLKVLDWSVPFQDLYVAANVETVDFTQEKTCEYP